MKREGRQHGMVRTYPIIAPPFNPMPGKARYINNFSSPPTAGLFNRVPQKPTNHSKFTSKCGRPKCTTCHIHPACKSKDKAKGTQKLRSRDAFSNYKLVTWRVVDAGPGLKFSGFSATGILDHLANEYIDSYDNDYEDDEPDIIIPPRFEIEEITDENKCVVNDDDEIMSFCEVGLAWEQMDEDEDWCMVEEI